MAQHDMVLDNSPGATIRSDTNAAILALVTNSSGATEPTSTYPFMWWPDTTADILKQRNAANTGWVDILTLSTGKPVGLSIGADVQAYVAPGTSGNVLTSTGSAWVSQAFAVPDNSVTPAKLTQKLTLATAVATTSGTSFDFTGIPSWVTRVSILFAGVSTSGTSIVQVQLGAGSIETTSYLGGGITQNSGGSLAATGSTTGLVVLAPQSATTTIHGVATLAKVTGNQWAWSAPMGASGNVYGGVSGGNKTLSGTLDRIRLTTVNGTDTFDAGSVNILYEG